MSKQKDASSVTFHYLKSSLFRVIHVDGAIGGLTPSGFIHMTVYSERAAIPKSVTQKINDEGKLGDEIKREGLDGIVREMEADLLFTFDEAILLRDWLDTKIKAASLSKQTDENATKDN